MPNLVDDFVKYITTPANPDIRDFCLDVLDLEIGRAENEVFCAPSLKVVNS